MFKKFVIAIVATSMIATPAFAGKFGGGSGFSRPSATSSRSFSAGTGYSYKPAAPAPAPAPARRFGTGATYNTAKPAQTQVVQRPVYTRGYNSGYHPAPVVNNHYYGGYGGYSGGWGSGITNNPFFWMWMFDHNRQQTLVVVQNGGGYAPQAQAAPVQGDPNQIQYAQAPQDNGPGFFGMIFWGLVNLIILIAVVAFLIWVFIKIRNLIKSNY